MKEYSTEKEYTEKYAKQNCAGNVEEAKQHAMVKEVCKHIKEREKDESKGF